MKLPKKYFGEEGIKMFLWEDIYQHGRHVENVKEDIKMKYAKEKCSTRKQESEFNPEDFPSVQPRYRRQT